MLNSMDIVKAKEGLNVRRTPEIVDGNILGILPDKTVVSILFSHKEWLEIEYFDKNIKKRGWVNGKYIISVENFVPEFVIGEKNLCNSANSIYVRSVINDEFNGGRRHWDLQCTEYVQYKFMQLGIKINWPVHHGRNGGQWANIFEKFEIYLVGNEPTIHSAMCFTDGVGTNIGHIAFVEEVNEDKIKISEANWPGDGSYNERILSMAEWKNKYKSKFISFI